MKELQTDNEILEFAISKEESANKLYLALAEMVEDEQVREVFTELAEEELEHKAKLELEIIKSGRSIDTTHKIEDFKISDYVISDSPTINMDYKDVLELGIQKEDAAFRLYVEMFSQVKEPDSRETLLAIAEQEIHHKLRFQQEYDRLLKGK